MFLVPFCRNPRGRAYPGLGAREEIERQIQKESEWVMGAERKKLFHTWKGN